MLVYFIVDNTLNKLHIDDREKEQTCYENAVYTVRMLNNTLQIQYLRSAFHYVAYCKNLVKIKKFEK